MSHTLPKRIIVCLSVRDGRLVHGRPGGEQRGAEDPAERAAQVQAGGADEVVLLHDAASAESRPAFIDALERTAGRVSIPIAAGGRFGDVDEIGRALQAGAAKVLVATSAVQRPELISESSRMFGSQCIVANISARREKRAIEQALLQQVAESHASAEPENWYRVFTHQGESGTQLDAVQWAVQCATLGAGEIVVASVDRAGSGEGYDLELVARVVEAVRIPVLASGGAGRPEHVRDAFVLAGADGALVDAEFTESRDALRRTKRLCEAAGVPVRREEDPSSPMVAE